MTQEGQKKDTRNKNTRHEYKTVVPKIQETKVEHTYIFKGHSVNFSFTIKTIYVNIFRRSREYRGSF